MNSSLTRSTDTASTVPCTSATNSQNNSLQRANLEFKVQSNPGEGGVTVPPIFRNGSANVNYNGNDLRHMSLSNPHLRITAGLGESIVYLICKLRVLEIEKYAFEDMRTINFDVFYN